MPRYDKFLGINNVDPPERLKNDSEGSELRAAVNVDIDKTGRVSRRDGYVKRYAGTNTHSLWSNGRVTLFVEDGTLKSLDTETWQATAIRTGMTRFGKVAYQDVFGDVYYTDGNQTGVYTREGVDTVMGIPTPPTKPVLVPGSGILPAGWYGVVFTAVDGAGRESGPTFAEFVELPNEGSIEVSGLPTVVAGASGINIYMTKPGGDVFYKHTSVNFAGMPASVTLSSLPTGHILRTKDLQPMPAGHMLMFHQQRLYVAADYVVYFSEPYNYGLTNIVKNFIQMPSRITMMQPVEDGFFISSEDEGVYIVNGRDPEQFSMRKVSDYHAVEGTGVEVPRETFQEGSGGRVCMWVSKDGIYAGMQGGSVKNLTQGKYAVRHGEEGIAVFRNKDGINQVLNVVKANDDPAAGVYTLDVAVAEIVRNGVVIT